MLQKEKSALRKTVLRSLLALSAEERESRSAEVVRGVLSLPVWAESVVVLGFSPLPGEVTITPLLERALASGSLFLPRIEGDELAFHRVSDLGRGLIQHAYGMLEPGPSLPRLEPESVGAPILVLTPGVAFDARGGRLGRGRGYYDRFLRGLRAATRQAVVAAAVAFSEQLVPWVPCGVGDERVDVVVTDREVLHVRPA